MDRAAADELGAVLTAWDTLSRRWGLSSSQLAAIFPYWSGEGRPDSDSEQRMRLLIRIGHRVAFPTVDHEREWLAAAPKRYGWLSPLDMMKDGVFAIRRLMRLVEREFG